MRYLLIIFLFSCTKGIEVPQIKPELLTCRDTPTQEDARLADKRRPHVVVNTDTFYKVCFYMDFNGHTTQSGTYWRNGLSWYSAPSTMTFEQQESARQWAQSTWGPYRVKVTTTESVYFSFPANARQRIVITPTDEWWTGVSGGNFTNALYWGNETPGFAFERRLYHSPQYVGQVTAHESGHGVGLGHLTEWDSNCQLVSSYKMGYVMGYPYVSNPLWGQTDITSYRCDIFQHDHNFLKSKNL